MEIMFKLFMIYFKKNMNDNNLTELLKSYEDLI